MVKMVVVTVWIQRVQDGEKMYGKNTATVTYAKRFIRPDLG